jgi:putative N6-adenine-specific DNA methylase
VAADIEWRRAAISAIAPPPGPGWLVTNPPYGVRVGERRTLRDLYAQLGNVARRCCPGWEVAFLAVHTELERQTGLALTVRLATENGGIRVRLVQGRV